MYESDSDFYVLNGTMDSASPSYVFRQADSDLLHGVKAGQLAYVLASRQMGKSSLMARSKATLESEDWLCANVDLTKFTDAGRDQDLWYDSLIDEIARGLSLDFDILAWRRENNFFSPLHRLTKFFEQFLLEQCTSPMVIFFDEIDSTVGLPFSDDFFAGIRACYNAKATNPKFRKLTFVLLGVATPAQLIRDPTRTPFNVGQGIELTDFTFEEAKPLEAGLSDDPVRASKRFRQVYDWTGGHPNLTQTVCWYAAKNPTWSVDEIVRNLFLSKQSMREQVNLSFVREWLTQRGSNLTDQLRLYHRIAEGHAVRDERTSPLHTTLKLSGVVKRNADGELKVRNKIYESVFSAQWVRSEMPREEQSSHSEGGTRDAYVMYDVLTMLPDLRSQAIEKLAQFWEKGGTRDEALITRIKGLQENDREESRRRVASLISSDYPCLQSTCVHHGPVIAAAFGLKGTRVATASADKTARLWVANTGEPVGPAFRHADIVRSVAVDRRGSWVVSGGDDYLAYVWDGETGHLRCPPLEHQGRVLSVALSPKDNYALTTSADGSITVWDLGSSECIFKMSCQAETPLAAFGPDGRRLVFSVDDETLSLWHLHFNRRFGGVIEHEDTITAVAFHPDGRVVATSSRDGTVRIWSGEWGLPINSPLMHQTAVLAIAFNPDGNLLATGCADGSVRLWNTETGEPMGVPVWHRDEVHALSFDESSERLVTGGADGVLRVWNVKDQLPMTPAFRHKQAVVAVSFSSGGPRVLSCAENEKVRLWNLDKCCLPEAEEPIRLTHDGGILAVTASGDGKLLATCGIDKIAKIWAHTQTFSPVLLYHPESVTTASFCEDGNMIATGCQDGGVRLWESGSGQFLQHMQHDAAVTALAFHPNLNLIATGSDDKSVSLWDVATGERIGPALHHWKAVQTVTFSTDGHILLTSSDDYTVRLWNVGSNNPASNPLRHSSALSAVAWAPNGEGVLTATIDGSINCWRPGPREENSGHDLWSKVFSVELHRRAESIVFTPEGDSFFVASEEWISLFRMEKGIPVLKSTRFLPGHWTGAFYWTKERDCIQIALFDTGSSVFCTQINLITPETAPLEIGSKEFLAEWQHRLGIRIDDRSRISPAFTS